MSAMSVTQDMFFEVRVPYQKQTSPAAISPIENPTRQTVGVEQIRHAKDQSEEESLPASTMLLSATPEGQEQKVEQAGEQHITEKNLGQRQPAQTNRSEKCRHPTLGLLAETTVIEAEGTAEQ